MNKKSGVLIGLLAVLNGSLWAANHWRGPTVYGRILFLMFLATAADFIPAGLHALALHIDAESRGNPHSRYLSWLMSGMALYSAGTLAAHAFFPPTISNYTLGFSYIYWSACFTKSYTMWLWSLYKWSVLNGHRKEAIRPDHQK